MSRFSHVTPFYVFNRLLIEYSNTVFRGIRRTPPVATDPQSEVVLFSILQRKDVRPYLVAAKSFLQYCPPISVVIQSDGSLADRDIAEISAHLPGASVLSRPSTAELLRSELPDSLLRLLEESHWFVELKLLNPLVRFPGKYVILFDADLLFMKRPDAVIECFSGPRPRTFHCPGGNGLADAFHQMGFDFSRVDIRSFNAGFFGFVNVISLASVEHVADTVRRYDPTLLREWEIEQALWSVLLNQTEDPLNLKRLDDQYVGNGWSAYEVLRKRATMAHFVGATRFKHLMYPRLATRVINELRSAR